MTKTDPRVPRDMAKAITRYEREATQILHVFIKTIEAKKPPPLLFHYTDDAGLAGIILPPSIDALRKDYSITSSARGGRAVPMV
jgi:hypothetical protein